MPFLPVKMFLLSPLYVAFVLFSLSRIPHASFCDVFWLDDLKRKNRDCSPSTVLGDQMCFPKMYFFLKKQPKNKLEDHANACHIPTYS